MAPLRAPVAAEVMSVVTDQNLQQALQELRDRGYKVDEAKGHPQVLLDEKHFRRVEKFVGSGGDWQEWTFSLIVATSKVALDCSKAMEEVIRQSGTIKDLNSLENAAKPEIMNKYGSELFSILCMLTGGEANVAVRSCVSKGGGYCGFAALCILSQRFNPKTPARILQYLATVLNPTPVKDVRLLERAMEEWEIRRGKLRAEFQEELSDTVQVAILTGMLPRDLQDMVFQMGHLGETMKYAAVRDRVMSIASHRAQMVTPSPMDIGYLGGPPGDSREYWEPEVYEVGAVTKGNCYACGGWGHMARECPTRAAKGKGKHKGGENAKGGWGKVGGKADGKGLSPYPPGKGVPAKGGGKGFGYQGTCYRCGVVGHKAAECTWKQVNEIAPETPAECQQQPLMQLEATGVASVGGVWSISAVSAAEEHEDVNCKSRGPVEDWQFVRRRGKASYPNLGKSNGKENGLDEWSTKPTKRSLGDCFGTEQKNGRDSRGTEQKNGRDSRGTERQTSPVQVPSGRFGVLSICPVSEEQCVQLDSAVCGVATEITVDSAAEESVCPLHWAEQFGLNPVEKGREMKLVNASGGRISHWGSRKVVMHAGEGGRAVEMGFQVTDVKKPLLSVNRLCEKGNIVQFGPKPQHNYVMNVETGERLQMAKRGNCWVLPGEFGEARHF